MQDSQQLPPEAEQPTSRPRVLASLNLGEFAADKFMDFLLIFIGLYAATALQRYQDVLQEKAEYIALLQDFKGELNANLEQEASIEKDLGAIDKVTPGDNLGPMASTFEAFLASIGEDEQVAHCLHVEYAAAVPGHALEVPENCHTLYAKFDKEHGSSESSFAFKPAVLTPFYRYEVWQLYLADGVKTFRNKALAVRIAEVYNNAKLIEKQVADIESTFNDTFMVQVARSAATDSELAEIIHDEETIHSLSPQNQQALIQVTHDVKDERFGATEAKAVLELKVERMKNTVLLLRKEINEVTAALDEELAAIED